MLRAKLLPGFWLAVCLSIPLHAQQPPPPGPTPAQILTAKRAFIANAPPQKADTGARPVVYSGGPYRAYDEFYDAMKNWGKFELVSSPGEADIVLQIRYDQLPITERQLQLVILDPKSSESLWWFATPLAAGSHRQDSDRLFDQAIAKLVQDVQNLVTNTSGPGSQGKSTKIQPPNGKP